MSWMLIGCAISLASELGIFEYSDEQKIDATHKNNARAKKIRRDYHRRIMLASLLYIYQEQLASRLGRKSMMPQEMTPSIKPLQDSRSLFCKQGEDWVGFIVAWTELTRIVKSISDVIFPSVMVTKHLLRSGRYVSTIEHFRSLLSLWKSDYLDVSGNLTNLEELLFLEYQCAKLSVDSLGLQAIVEKLISDGAGTQTPPTVTNLSSTDYKVVQTVVEDCLATLKVAIALEEQGRRLQFAPVRVFLRTATASIFLVKGLSLGIRSVRLRSSVSVLERTVAALRSGTPDDLHLGSRYAILLEIYVSRLQEKFIHTVRPGISTAPVSPSSLKGSAEDNDTTWIADAGCEASSWLGMRPPSSSRISAVGGAQCCSTDSEMNPTIPESFGDLDENWPSLPLDMSLLPLMADEFQDLQWLGEGS
ncbi:hypothetical protein HJFPF1_02356 [Paramyrothecium foliicola]|nr:hypothetical protein HJFPF1_02356 [Paramyrothecium foliicola]